MFGGRQESEPKSSHWGQASLPSTQLSQVTLFPSLPGAATFPLPLGQRCQAQEPNYLRRPPPLRTWGPSGGQTVPGNRQDNLERGKMVPTQSIPANKRPQKQSGGRCHKMLEGIGSRKGGGATQTSQSQLYDDPGGGQKSRLTSDWLTPWNSGNFSPPNPSLINLPSKKKHTHTQPTPSTPYPCLWAAAHLHSW